MNTKQKIIAVLTGALTFFLFVNILEGFAHLFFIITANPVSNFINGNIIAFTLYAALAAGIFEETGRLVAFKFILKKYKNRQTSIFYGLGHGGIEFLFLLIAFVSAVSLGTAAPLWLVLWERASALILHISLSVLVFYAVKKSGCFHYYPIAILLHAGIDTFAALYQKGIIQNIILLEVLISAYSLAAAYWAYRIYRRMPDTSETNTSVVEE